MIKDIILRLLGRKPYAISENQRGCVLRNHQFHRLLGPGRHWLGRQESLMWFDQNALVYDMQTVKRLMALPGGDTALARVETTANQVCVLERDGQIFALLQPEERAAYWADTGHWQLHTIDLDAGLAVETSLAKRLLAAQQSRGISLVDVPLGHQALVYHDGVLLAQLAPGRYCYWNCYGQLTVVQCEVRKQAMELIGQELLSKDRVTIRVNVTATYQLHDAVKAYDAVADYKKALYGHLQTALRAQLSTVTLDQLLADQNALDQAMLNHARPHAEAMGLSLDTVVLKDVILPGEMRLLLNQVVEASKQAEANVIRRREETNATRSLLNTAKVMAENPMMLRLRELEALESIASKVEQLTIHNGTEGLLNQVVRLRDDEGKGKGRGK